MRLNNLVGKWSVMGLPTKKYCLPTKKLVGNSVIFSSVRDLREPRKLMEPRELREPRELMDEVLDVSVEHKVA